MNEAQQVNGSFGVPADVVARLREQAEAEMAGLDEEKLLDQFRQEALAKKTAALRAQAEAEAEAAGHGEGKDIDAHGFPKKYFKITVHGEKGKHAMSYVPVSVNGFAWRIQRDVPVILPSVAITALNSAVAAQTIQTADRGIILRPYLRFPFQVHGEATEAEYRAFMAEQRKAHAAEVAQQVAA